MRSRRFAAAGAAAVVLVAGTGASPALGDPPQCPVGFNGGAQTFEQRLNDPGVQAALAAGVITLDEAMAGFSVIDENGNGLVCVQDNAQRTENAAEIAGWVYFDNVRDDLG
jgi:hypothetical protein